VTIYSVLIDRTCNLQFENSCLVVNICGELTTDDEVSFHLFMLWLLLQCLDSLFLDVMLCACSCFSDIVFVCNREVKVAHLVRYIDLLESFLSVRGSGFY